MQGRITPLKTEASRTDLTIPEAVLMLLREWRERSIFRAESDWVFASPYNKGALPYWPAQLMKTHIVPVATKAGLPHLGWHSFRHTVSAWGKQAGLELEEVEALLRHENLATTSQVYGRLELEAKRKAQQRLIDYVVLDAAAHGWKGAPALLQGQTA